MITDLVLEIFIDILYYLGIVPRQTLQLSVRSQMLRIVAVANMEIRTEKTTIIINLATGLILLYSALLLSPALSQSQKHGNGKKSKQTPGSG